MTKRKNQDELAAFIKKELRRGYPQGELTNELMNQGYSSDEIQKAFLANTSFVQEEGKFPLWYVFSVGFLVLGITLILVDITWLSKYKWISFIVGLIGVIAWTVVKNMRKEKDG